MTPDLALPLKNFPNDLWLHAAEMANLSSIWGLGGSHTLQRWLSSQVHSYGNTSTTGSYDDSSYSAPGIVLDPLIPHHYPGSFPLTPFHTPGKQPQRGLVTCHTTPSQPCS